MIIEVWRKVKRPPQAFCAPCPDRGPHAGAAANRTFSAVGTREPRSASGEAAGRPRTRPARVFSALSAVRAFARIGASEAAQSRNPQKS